MNVFVMYDMQNKTWNIMKKNGAQNIDSECMLYGNIEEICEWLDDNKGLFTEVKN